MKNILLVPTGYMGSGSSAVTDLVSEIDGFDRNRGDYEYVFLHCPDGVFDLEDKLLRGNNAVRSDEAIHSFLRAMEKLYRPGYWFSDYGQTLSPGFLEDCRRFVGDLRPIRPEGAFWYYQEDAEAFSDKVRRAVRRRVAALRHTRLLGGLPVTPLTYTDTAFAFPTEEEFYTAARALLDRLLTALGGEEHPLVLDQLLLPHNLWRIDRYFGGELRVVVVERDPRDVFLLNKYYWGRSGSLVPYPMDAADFCEMYARMRRSERRTDDPRVLRLRFEDLVYRTDEVLPALYALLGTDAAAHAARRGTIFRPAVSAKNTQLFRRDERFRPEAELIAARLGEYLYDFPDAAPDWSAADVF